MDYGSIFEISSKGLIAFGAVSVLLTVRANNVSRLEHRLEVRMNYLKSMLLGEDAEDIYGYDESRLEDVEEFCEEVSVLEDLEKSRKSKIWTPGRYVRAAREVISRYGLDD